MSKPTVRSIKHIMRAVPLVIAAQYSLAATNLVTNGDFETGTAGWSSVRSALSADPRAGFASSLGMRMAAGTASNWCPYGAVINLDTNQFVLGTMYEIGVRTRLEADAATPAGTAARVSMGLIINGADPVWLDGFANTAYAYPDRWTRLFGAHKANFLSTDTVKLCVSSPATAAGVIKTAYIDDVFVRPLTRAEVGYTPPATMDGTQLVSAHGNQLVVGATTTPILLKGINLYGYNNGCTLSCTALENFGFKDHDESSFQEIANLGFNTVRFMMSYILFEDDTAPGVYKEEGWAFVDRAIMMAKKYNLRLILDMHEPPGGGQLPNRIDMNSRPDIQQRLENLWVAIAQRYRTEDAVAAYDLVNEPYMDNWFLYAPTLIQKIRAVDPDHAILVEWSYHPNDIGNPSRFYPLPYANLIYDAHYYDAYSETVDSTTYNSSAAFFKSDLIDTFASFYNAATGMFTVPLHVGEYGVVHQKYQTEQNLGAEQWMQDLTAAMNDLGIHRSVFAYNEGRFGLYQGWNTYPGESTITNTSLMALMPTLNNAEWPAIIFGAAPTVAAYGSGVVSVTALSAQPVTFSSMTPTICSITGNTVTGLATGTCTIAADQPADPASGTAAAHATQSFAISKAAQTIALTTPVSLPVGSTGTATATATSNLPVTLVATPATVCTVSAGTVTAKAVGTCKITATQTGNATWNAAPQVAKNITIAALKTQTITVTATPTALPMGATATVTATATSGLPVALTVTTPLICSIAGNIVTPIKAGTCTVNATQAGNATWKAATAVNKNITVSQKTQTITFTAPTTFTRPATATFTATATSTLPVTVTTTTPTICSVSGTTITGVAAGICKLSATQTGDATWKAATAVAKSVTVK